MIPKRGEKRAKRLHIFCRECASILSFPIEDKEGLEVEVLHCLVCEDPVAYVAEKDRAREREKKVNPWKRRKSL